MTFGASSNLCQSWTAEEESLEVQASIKIETDSDIEEEDSSCRKRHRISDGGLRDISEAPTLVDVSINTSSLERTTDGNLEITSRIDPRLL
jgi:hypothetical protein